MSKKQSFLVIIVAIPLILAIIIGSGAASPVTPTDIITLNPIKDATIISGTPNNSNTGVSIGNHATNGEYRTLIQFDLASIPANSTIVSATLQLHMIINRNMAEGGTDVTSHALLANWTEASVTWNNAPSFVAAVDPPTNLVVTPSWVDFDVTNLVDDWVTGGVNNYGMLMRGDGSLGVYSFFSRESAALKPRLHISYITNTPTNTPTTTPNNTPTHTPTPASGCPGTIVLQPDADTRIVAGAPANNYGSQNRLDVGRDLSNREYTLLHFPVESVLNPGKYVHDAYLRLHVQDVAIGLQPPWPVSVYTLNSGFDETAVTWNTQSGFRDYVTTADLPNTNEHQINGLGQLVQDWHDGSIVNTGLALAASAGDFVLQYDSREGSSPPELVITCSNQPPNDPTPTPIPTNCDSPITLYATRDAVTNQNYSSWTFGADLGVKIGRANGLKYSYLRFPIDQLPQGYYIYSAELQMDVQRWDGDGRSFYGSSLFRLTSGLWNEAQLAWDNAPSAVNSSPNKLNYDIYDTHTWNMLDEVRTWYHNEDFNYGLFIRSADPVLVTYDSRETGNPARLVIECGPEVPTITPTFTATPTSTPSPTPTPTAVPVDFVAEAIEITQGLQNLQNDIELIAGKRTYVHFYGRVRQNGQFINLNNNFMAVMEATRNGEPIGFGGVKPPIEIPDSLKANGWNRETDGFLFKMPSSWSAEPGTIELTVRFLTINEPSGNWGNNDITMNVTFVDTPPICHVYSRVRTSNGYPAANIMTNSVAGFNHQWRALNMLPTYSMWDYFQSEPIEKLDFCLGFIPCGYTHYNTNGGTGAFGIEDGNLILISLQTRDVFSDDPDECDDADARTHYVGTLLPQSGSQGRAFRDYDQMWFMLNQSNGGTVDGALINAPWGGRTIAHELGHNYNRKHVDCGNPDDPAGNYPYPPCQFSDVNPGNPAAEMYGFDIITEKYIISTAPAGDLMSYANTRWTSDFTWNAIYNRLQSQDFLVSEAAKAVKVTGGEVMWVTAVLYPDSNTGTFAYLTRADSSLFPTNELTKLLDGQQGSDYTLLMLDSGGTTLATRPFTPVAVDDTSPHSLLASFAVPYDVNTAKIELRQGGTLIDSREASDNPPTVQLLTPNGGQTVGNSLTVTWNADDADGDWLLYTLQYSNDNGQSWQVIANELITPTYTIEDTTSMAGSNGQSLIRVIANDGWHTAYDESDTTFTLPLHAPEVFIHSETEFFTDTIELIGSAIDAEDFQLTGEALRWSVDALGIVGWGETAVLQDMPPGSYEVTLTATDSDGMIGTATVTIVVRERGSTIYLPFISR